ncbi:MAG: prolipoprotein diacylglyceryl transferase [Spirochaetales bacterium]
MPLFLTFPDWIKPEIIPGLPIRWYGLMYILAFLITYALFLRQAKASGLQFDTNQVQNFFFSGLAGMLVGARIFATLIYDTTGRYWAQPWLIFWPFGADGTFTGFAGMSYHGAVLGIVLGLFLYAGLKKIDILLWGDWVVAGAPLGYLFGRLGNFINSELWGRVTAAPWGMVFPNGEPLPVKEAWVADAMQQTGVTQTFMYGGVESVNLPRHPSQLYEALGEGLLLWLILWFLLRPNKPFKGFLVGAYLIGYGVIRFVIEYFRNPDKGLDFIITLQPGFSTSQLTVPLFNFSMGQILCAAMIVIGAVWLVVCGSLDKKAKLAEAAKTPPKASGPRKRR